MTERVVLYTRQDCHLCEDALLVVRQVCDAAKVPFTSIDIDSDPELAKRYTDEVPVVTVDGETVGFWRIRPELLRAALGD